MLLFHSLAVGGVFNGGWQELEITAVLVLYQIIRRTCLHGRDGDLLITGSSDKHDWGVFYGIEDIECCAVSKQVIRNYNVESL